MKLQQIADRLSDFKLVIGIVIERDEDWCGVGRPQVVIYCSFHIFYLFLVSLVEVVLIISYYISSDTECK